MLSVRNLEVAYYPRIVIVRDVSLDVKEGTIVALLGPNGAGKTTTLNAISGIIRIFRGTVTGGSVNFMGRDITNASPESISRLGIVHVMDGRRVFPDLTVEENLLASGDDLDIAYQYFPRLRERRRIKAGYLSGGEQQMLVIARALIKKPRLILLDEPSLGLAPIIVDQLFNKLREIVDNEKVSILLAEQNAVKAMEIANYA